MNFPRLPSSLSLVGKERYAADIVLNVAVQLLLPIWAVIRGALTLIRRIRNRYWGTVAVSVPDRLECHLCSVLKDIASLWDLRHSAYNNNLVW